MDKFSQLWTELQQTNRLPRGILTSQCEVELKEVMTQIDLIFNVKRREWQSEVQNLKGQLSRSERLIETQTANVAFKEKAVVDLRTQLSTINVTREEMVQRYESQVISLQSSVQKMRQDYDRLQKKYQKSMLRSTQSDGKLNKDIETQPLAESTSNTTHLTNQIMYQRSEIERLIESAKKQDALLNTLKSTLDSVTSAHQDSLHTNERLLNDLTQASGSMKKLEDDKHRLQTELVTTETRLGLMNSDDRDHNDALQRLQHNMEEKDNIIRMLTDVKNREENEQLSILQQQLTDTNRRLIDVENREQDMRMALERKNNEFMKLRQAYERQCSELRLEIGNTKRLSEEEISRLLTEIMKLTDKYAMLENGFSAKGRAFKDELSQVVEEAYKKGMVVADLKARLVQLESALKDSQEALFAKDMELQNAQSQLMLLRETNSRATKEPSQKQLRYGDTVDSVYGRPYRDERQPQEYSLYSQNSQEDNDVNDQDFISLTDISPVAHHKESEKPQENAVDKPPRLWEGFLDMTHHSTLSMGQGDRPDSRQSVAQKFLDDEVEHALMLKQKLNRRIIELETNTLDTVNKYAV